MTTHRDVAKTIPPWAWNISQIAPHDCRGQCTYSNVSSMAVLKLSLMHGSHKAVQLSIFTHTHEWHNSGGACGGSADGPCHIVVVAVQSRTTVGVTRIRQSISLYDTKSIPTETPIHVNSSKFRFVRNTRYIALLSKLRKSNLRFDRTRTRIVNVWYSSSKWLIE